MRPQDVVARVGGDEFIVLAKDVGANDDAVLLGERLVTCVRELSRQGGLPRITVSASAGRLRPVRSASCG